MKLISRKKGRIIIFKKQKINKQTRKQVHSVDFLIAEHFQPFLQEKTHVARSLPACGAFLTRVWCVPYSQVVRSLLASGAFLTRKWRVRYSRGARSLLACLLHLIQIESPNTRHVNTFYFIFISSTAMIFLKTIAIKENKHTCF